MTIYFLGPSKDDFHDAKRLLLQSLRSPSSNEAIAVFGASQNHAGIAPVPIEIGNGLPFLHRTREWSRWSKIIKRNQDNDAVKSEPQATTEMAQMDDKSVLKSAVRRIEKLHRLSTHLPAESPPLVPPSPHWEAILRQSNSVTIGRVIYPTDVIQQVHKKIITRWKKGKDISPRMWQDLLGPHEFLMSSNGLLLSFDDKISQMREFLLIKLSPKRKGKHVPVAPSTNDCDLSKTPKQAPDLEIYLDIDQDRQYVAPKEMRAIFSTKKTDLLLPKESNDFRFVSNQYVISSPELDPNLSAFIQASNLNLWGSERLKTPPSLVLDVPGFNSREQGRIEDLGPIEYVFTALEHRTQLSAVRDGFQYEYTMIEAGRIGGQREEFRIEAQNRSEATSEKPPTTFRDLFSNATRWVSNISLTLGSKKAIVHRLRSAGIGQAADGKTGFRRILA